ncbi:hypothetical protein GMRT_12204 [Giardia muris]|uniref:Uncharacterized protein n=1 Tax=Giardia muris TaxID=5742 RepID=A0A4Z1SPR0_GIAMU|nr:hypothetical protein GMRT_12204 [Giardia muris]|eukprot:TNJ27812.1 hypothetical protein GMRT_12204 [Giardia muris]
MSSSSDLDCDIFSPSHQKGSTNRHHFVGFQPYSPVTSVALTGRGNSINVKCSNPNENFDLSGFQDGAEQLAMVGNALVARYATGLTIYTKKGEVLATISGSYSRFVPLSPILFAAILPKEERSEVIIFDALGHQLTTLEANNPSPVVHRTVYYEAHGHVCMVAVQTDQGLSMVQVLSGMNRGIYEQRSKPTAGRFNIEYSEGISVFSDDLHTGVIYQAEFAMDTKNELVSLRVSCPKDQILTTIPPPSLYSALCGKLAEDRSTLPGYTDQNVGIGYLHNVVDNLYRPCVFCICSKTSVLNSKGSSFDGTSIRRTTDPYLFYTDACAYELLYDEQRREFFDFHQAKRYCISKDSDSASIAVGPDISTCIVQSRICNMNRLTLFCVSTDEQMSALNCANLPAILKPPPLTTTESPPKPKQEIVSVEDLASERQTIPAQSSKQPTPKPVTIGRKGPTAVHVATTPSAQVSTPPVSTPPAALTEGARYAAIEGTIQQEISNTVGKLQTLFETQVSDLNGRVRSIEETVRGTQDISERVGTVLSTPQTGLAKIPIKFASNITLGNREPTKQPFGERLQHTYEELAGMIPQSATFNLVPVPPPDFGDFENSFLRSYINTIANRAAVSVSISLAKQIEATLVPEVEKLIDSKITAGLKSVRGDAATTALNKCEARITALTAELEACKKRIAELEAKELTSEPVISSQRPAGSSGRDDTLDQLPPRAYGTDYNAIMGMLHNLHSMIGNLMQLNHLPNYYQQPGRPHDYYRHPPAHERPGPHDRTYGP